jgi:hypothetical protein
VCNALAGDQQLAEARLSFLAEHALPSSAKWARSSYQCISFPSLFNVEVHAPNDCLRNGERAMLDEALMCIIYLFKWSMPALHPALTLTSLATTGVKGLQGYFLSTHFVKTPRSSVTSLRLE